MVSEYQNRLTQSETVEEKQRYALFIGAPCRLVLPGILKQLLPSEEINNKCQRTLPKAPAAL